VQCANARIARYPADPRIRTVRDARITGFGQISEPESVNLNQGSIRFHSLPPRPKVI
jgi:hypothetical protein